MNALRFGGSQTFAASLAADLAEHGFEPIVVAKRGDLSSSFARTWDVEHVVWAEGTGSAGGVRQGIAHWLGHAAIVRLARRLRANPPLAWIASQPWPIHYAASTRRRAWPRAARIALVHGTTAVEIPPPGGREELAAMDRVFTTTPEAAAALEERYDLEALSLGNLFDADAYWGRPRTPPAADGAPERVLFLGTLTANKVPPLRALIELAAAGGTFELEVAGEGDERAGLEELARRFGVRAAFRGGLLDPREEIERADLVVAAGRAAVEAASRPRRAIVANGDGIFGALAPDTVDLCRRYNFTGRAPGSGPSTAAEMERAMAEARALGEAQLAATAAALARLGDAGPLVEFLRSWSAKKTGPVGEGDLRPAQP